MKKTKLKFGIFALLTAIGLTVGFFFTGYLNLLLTGQGADDISAFHPARIATSVADDSRHRQLLLLVGLIVISGAGAVTLMNRRETFESDTSPIAGEIQTPVAIGQGQHGTARWLKKSERGKAFAVFRLDPSEPTFAALLDAGQKDGEVMHYNEETLRISTEKPQET
ncbi:MAG: hypothetical protein LBK41_00455 [Clostridiales bacterium]|jgi:type IV secretion system protein VirD4|nr:hypothetical protein [Clostridiales bacterium]